MNTPESVCAVRSQMIGPLDKEEQKKSIKYIADYANTHLDHLFVKVFYCKNIA